MPTAALMPAAERGVGLDAVDQDNAVGLTGIFVDVDGQALRGAADLLDLHGGDHRGAHRFLCDAVAAEHLGLTLGGGAAVAAHGGDQNGLSALGLDKGNHCLDQKDILVDTPAAAGDGDAGAGLDGGAGFLQTPQKSPLNILQHVIVEGLADFGHLWDRVASEHFCNF